MKKLLSLLSILTISGTAIPTTIAASPYQKEETKLKNSDINYQQINNLGNLQRIKRGNVKELSGQKMVIWTNGSVNSSGVVLNNKLYFGSADHNVYKYDPSTKRKNIVIETAGNVTSSGVVLDNKLYVGSQDHNVYEYDPATGQQKIVITTNSYVESSGVVLDNKLYVGSFDSNVYEYDPSTKKHKVVIKTNGGIKSSGVVLNNKVYFGSADHNVYEYDPNTKQQKIVIITNNSVFSSGVVLNNKVYFGSADHNVYEYDPNTKQQKIVIRARDVVNSSGIIFNNKLYVGSQDHNVYEYDPATGQQKIVITTNSYVESSGVVLNDKLYFGSYDGKIYEYNPATGERKVVIWTNDGIISSGVVLDNKLYVGSQDHNVYEYYEKINLNKIITNNNLNLINISNKEISDKAILNELNYRNPNLDISQLEIVNKKRSSATIKVKDASDKYFGEKQIYFIVDSEDSKNVYLRDLIKKAIFFKFRDDNHNLEFSKIKDIDFTHLQYSNTELKETIKPNIVVSDPVFNCSGASILSNETSLIQTIKTRECSVSYDIEKRIQLSNGLIKSRSLEQGQTNGTEQTDSYGSSVSKTNTKSLEAVDAFENIDVKQSSESSGWHAELSVNANASFNVGFASGGVSTTYSGGYNKNSETSQSHSSGHTNSKSTGNIDSNQEEETKTKIITNNSNSSSFNSTSKNISLEKNESNTGSETLKVTWPSQDVKVNPNKKVVVSFITQKIAGEIVLDLKQDIGGDIIIKVENKDGEEETIDFSIGELMQKLIKYKLLPPQISLSEFNENDVYFEGKIRFLIENYQQENIKFGKEQILN